MTPLLYIILEGIDLGDTVHGVFTTRDNAERALAQVQTAYVAAMGHRHQDLTIGEFPADQVECECRWKKTNSR